MDNVSVDDLISVHKGTTAGKRLFNRRYHRDSDEGSDKRKEPITEIFKTIYISFKKGIYDLQIKSDIVQEFFAEVTFPNTKCRARLFIKGIIIFCIQSLIVLATTPASTSRYDLLTLAALCVICSMVYGWTVKPMISRHHNIKRNSILLDSVVLLVLAVISPTSTHVLVTVTPMPQVVILIYSVFLIHFELTVFLCIFMSCVAFSAEAAQLLSVSSLDYTGSMTDYLWLSGTSMYGEDYKRMTEKFYQRREFYGFLLLWITLNGTGCYLYAMSRLRQLSAFRQLAQNIEIRERISAQKEETMQWISAVMPSSIIPQYMKFVKESERTHGKESNELMSVFSRSYSDVSILFADIVGFTNMSSNKTATEVVMLLNDLFNRFDRLCRESGCEKLGTLGDCYYCVAGCPNPRNDHAICCVRMGLGMCVIIKSFNRQYNESVNMRVGVHTGRVNAAVIGKIRFRYDVYSYAVIIANEMESSGMPGKVHISQSTFERIKNCFTTEPGEDFEFKTEKAMGMQGMIVSTEVMKTYFVVDRRAEAMRNLSGEHEDENETQSKSERKNQKLEIFTIEQKAVSSETSENSEESINLKKGAMFRGKSSEEKDELADDERLIRAMKEDPEHQAHLFKLPPLHPITLNFISDEVERAFRDQMFSDEATLTIESSRLAPFLDCFTSTIFVIIYTIVCSCLCHKCNEGGSNVLNQIRLGISTTQVFLSVIITMPLFLDLIRRSSIFKFNRTFTMRNVRSLIFSGMPMVTMLSYFQCFENEADKKNFHRHISRLATYNLLASLLLASGSSWVNIAAACAKTGIIIMMYNQNYFCKWLGYVSMQDMNISSAHRLCVIMAIRRQHDNGIDNDMIDYQTSVLATCLLVAFLVRGNDFNLRLCFFATYEADRKRREAEDASQQTETLLYNIVPKYVMSQLLERGATLKSASYAISVPNAAVTFACISNFFATYYREDYKGGESALALLNKIICLFDDTMKKYKYVEKIKTINDCYMVASGLNVREVDQSLDNNAHLYALMDYCLHLLDIMKHFNETWVIGDEKFSLKVGYNIGPVTAGIIGTTKPMYDIWGDTVNVSSRMYSTSKPGLIQCPKSVRIKLRTKYKFRRRGYISVKGKGQMKVYLCVGRKRRI